MHFAVKFRELVLKRVSYRTGEVTEDEWWGGGVEVFCNLVHERQSTWAEIYLIGT